MSLAVAISIALVVGEENVKVFADPFFARILLSFGRELAEVDLQLVLLTLHTPRDYRMVARYLRMSLASRPPRTAPSPLASWPRWY